MIYRICTLFYITTDILASSARYHNGIHANTTFTNVFQKSSTSASTSILPTTDDESAHILVIGGIGLFASVFMLAVLSTSCILICCYVVIKKRKRKRLGIQGTFNIALESKSLFWVYLIQIRVSLQMRHMQPSLPYMWLQGELQKKFNFSHVKPILLSRFSCTFPKGNIS